MGKRRAILSIIGAAVLCAVLPAAADTKSEINQAYEVVKKAFLTGNVKLLNSVATPDFTYKHEDGRVDKLEKMNAEMAQMYAMGMKVTKFVYKIEKIQLKGNTAVVTSTGISEMKMKTPDGKTSTMADKSRTKDTLVKTAKGWKFKNVTVLKSDMTMDGKPFDPAMMMSQPPPKKK